MVLGSCVAAGAWFGRDLMVGLGVGRQHHQGDIEAALAVRRRRRWAAWRGGAWSSSCDHAATSSAVLCRSFGVVPQIQFIDRVDGVRDGVLLVLPSVVHRDRYPGCFFFAGFGVLQYIDKVVDVWERGCSMEACERISHIFYVLFAWNSDLISSSPLFWQPLAPVRCDSPRWLLDEFRLFSA